MEGRTDLAIKFLKMFYPKGPWLITSISTDRKGINTSVFGPNTEEQCIAYIDKYNGDRNMYFTVNRPSNGFFKRDNLSKPTKEDMFEARWLHVDVDPTDGQDIEEERTRILEGFTTKLPKGIPEPTCILFSGGGYQAFWQLDDPYVVDGDISKCEEFELFNKRLEQVFSGDHCHNIDRIMRLPGTINVPDAKKRKKGRVPQLAKLLHWEGKNVYEAGTFKKATAVQTGGGTSASQGAKVNIPGNIEPIEDLSELDKWDVPDRIKVIVAQGMHPDQPKEGDNSRSAWLFDCVCGLTRHNVPDEVIFSLLMDPEWLISASVLELKGGAARYAARQIGRAKEYSQDPNLTEMNDRHAVIGNMGGKCLVIEEVMDDQLNRAKLTFASFEAVRNRYSNRKIKVGETKEGQDQMVPLGKYWLDHPMRRQYDTIKFMPNSDKDGVYNLWQGFNVEPRPGDCSLYLDHIRENICGGVEENYEYLICWMARVVQYPATAGEVAIVLRGGKGTGKGVFARNFGRLFGRHHVHVANAKHLVGQFNAHLKDCVSLFADEAFFAGDKQHESVLKMLITEDTIPIEMKGVDLETYPNYVHLIMASNDPHVVRATGDERRYFVLDINKEKQQDSEYFARIHDQLNDGGYEALLFMLQSYDLEGFDVRKVPQTDALREQKLLSMSQNEEWWYQKLRDGRVLEGHSIWENQVPSKVLEEDFTRYANTWKFSRLGNATQLGRFLTNVCPHMTKTQRRVAVEEHDQYGGTKREHKRVYFYDFGSLEQCRAAWDNIYGKAEWPEPVEMKTDNLETPF